MAILDSWDVSSDTELLAVADTLLSMRTQSVIPQAPPFTLASSPFHNCISYYRVKFSIISKPFNGNTPARNNLTHVVNNNYKQNWSKDTPFQALH